MKKLIIALLTMAIVCAFAAPAMADPADSPVKSYADAEDGELLYTVDFSGKDGVMELGNIGDKQADKHFYFTPSEDGTSLHIYGRDDSDDEDRMYTAYWGDTIPSLEANFSTTYTLVYKIRMNGENGLNNSIGVGSYFVAGDTGESMSAYHLYGNFNTKAPGNDTSMRRSSLSINNMKQPADNKPNDYIAWNTLPAYEEDEDGFVTVMLVYEGSSLLMTAYIRAEGAGEGSKESDWIKVEELVYVPSDDCIGLMVYAYYLDTVDVTVKDAMIYKGKIFSADEPVAPPADEPTEAPTQPTQKPVQKPTEPAANKPSEFPIGIVIGIAAGVIVIAAVVVIVLKKKKA